MDKGLSSKSSISLSLTHGNPNRCRQVNDGIAENIYLNNNYSNIILKMYDIFTFQFDLVCDKSLLGTISTSVIFAGWLLGALAGGVLADKIGRKPVMFVFAFMCSFFALLAAFPNVFWLFIVFRLLVGISIGKHNKTTKIVLKCSEPLYPILVAMCSPASFPGLYF